MVADSQLWAATQFMENSIPALLGEIELWVRSGGESASLEQKRIMREALDEVEVRLRRVNGLF